jgi:deazaflavin-dependent oxidoreductase (nitroreductase family)
MVVIHPPQRRDQRIYIAERERNVFVNSATGGRVLSGLMLPWFTLLPPAGWGVLTTTGRKSGKARRKCVRAVRRGNKVYLVAIRPGTAWLKNIRADAEVRLRLRGGRFTGAAREPVDAVERQEAMGTYCETTHLFDYVGCIQHRRGRPNAPKVRELHRTWFDLGVPLVIDLDKQIR